MAGLINYVRKVFKNYPDTSTPTTAENLNVMDKGIYDLDQALGTAIGNADISGIGDGSIKGAVSQLNNDLNDKIERMTNVSDYQTVDVLGYNPTTKKLGLKVNGADTVIPFNSGISNTFSYSLINNKGGNTDVDIFIPQDVSSITINYTAKSSYVSTGVYVDGTFHDVTSSPITYPVSTKITLHIFDQYTNNSATFKVIFNN